MKMKKFAALLMMFCLCAAVGCNDDDNDGPDPDPKPAINEIFVASTGTWAFDLNSFGGAFKTAYDEAKTALLRGSFNNHVLQWMKLSKDNLEYLTYEEDMKEAGGAEEEHYNLLGEDRLRPIINVRPEGNDIYNKLESLLANTNKISQLSADSIEYIKKHHCPIKVAKECLDFWEKN